MSFTPYAQSIGHIPADVDVDTILHTARYVLSQLDGISSCHEAVDAWIKVTNKGKAVRGWFYPIYEHSWVDMGTFILDIYPVGGCRPHLVSKHASHRLYLLEL
jgi:hypothetical protein